MIVLRLALQLVLLSTLLIGTQACVQVKEFDAALRGFNPRLRPDRLPLSVEQQELETRLDSLRFGPYRTGSGDLVRPLTPGTGKVEHLPQSDCWWMGQAALGGGDSLAGNWEALLEIVGSEELLEDFHDPDDGKLDIGLCRFNDPETRVPPRAHDDGSMVFSDLDCSTLGNGTALTFSQDRNFFRCSVDTVWLDTTLAAYASSANDPLMRCDVLRGSFDRLDRRIGKGMDFYDGVSGDGPQGPLVAACAADRLLIPPTPTRYQLQQSENSTQWLDPVAIPVTGARLGRVMRSGSGGAWVWSTPSSSASDGKVRWQENFSPSLAVSKVRFFDLDSAGNRIYLDPQPRPNLCIEDPQGQSGCRWVCPPSTAADGRAQYDLMATNACSTNGIPEIPRVTPAYAKSTVEALELVQPLRWSALFTRANPPFIELELITTFEPAALRAAPAMTDLGGARVGQYARASFVVENVGGHPMRITSVAMDPSHGGNAADFSVQIPTLPVPEPLPIEVTGRDTKEVSLKLSRDAESQQLLWVYTDFAHGRLSRRGAGFSARIGNHTVVDDHGLLLRDRSNPGLPFNAALTPAARTSHSLRTPPFTIQPGERFEVSARGRPGASGERVGYARIAAESALDPAQRVTVWAALKVHGMQGPLVSVAPGQLVIGVEGNGIARDRAVLIQNAGDTTATIGAPRLTATGGGTLAPDSQFVLDDPYGGGGPLGSGDSRVVRVQYLSDCGRHVVSDFRDEAAELRWTTPDGPIAVRIDSSAYCGP